jgi:hypothetical protein
MIKVLKEADTGIYVSKDNLTLTWVAFLSEGRIE